MRAIHVGRVEEGEADIAGVSDKEVKAGLA